MALELDTSLRHLEIDAEFGDWPIARVHLAEAQATWELLEPALARRIAGRADLRGASEALRDDMDRALAHASDGVNAARTGEVLRWARQAIVIAEAIERVFE
jgi:hypothetical protein